MHTYTTPNFSDNALAVLKERYLWRNEHGEIIETPQDMLERVAGTVATAEQTEVTKRNWAVEFYEVMAQLDFLPNSPTLVNAGRPRPYGQLSACFVIDVSDSMEGIFDALKQTALITKSGGGIGANYSKLRSNGARINSTNGKASGPVSFMSMFDLSIDVVRQGGMRRGALMGVLDCKHSDLDEFIHSKTKDGKLSNFNISVMADDDFMKFEKNQQWAIAKQAWKTGDPGLLFFDRINLDNPTPHLGYLNAVNPCGETSLYPNEACNLGSINLAHMVKSDGTIDHKRLQSVVKTATRFLNDVIDINHYPLPEIEAAVKRTRKIGLGVMGWAEMLFQMGIPYASERAVDLAVTVMDEINNVSHLTSQTLAKGRGAYPECKTEVQERNATCTCIAPTGTISLLADTSSGIEPLFALRHKRIAFAKENKQELEYYNKYYQQACENSNKSTEYIKEVFEDSVAHKVSPYWHVAHQAAFQDHTDLAVSKTINLPNSATIQNVYDIYRTAWLAGCKGITVYRDGCKNEQVLYDNGNDDDDVCPVCGAKLVHKDGCVSCSKCTWGGCKVS